MQSQDKSNYLFHRFNIFGHYCNKMPSLKIKNWVVKGVPKTHFGLRLATRALPCFTEKYHLFYKNNIKCVPTDIYNLLHPIALAHWIMGVLTNLLVV